MNEENLRQLLSRVSSGALSVDEALARLKGFPYELVGDFARVDHQRAARQGFPEIVFAEGKTPEQVSQIIQSLSLRNEKVLATRVSQEMYAALQPALPGAVYHPPARILILDRSTGGKLLPGVLVVSGGTADIPVAEEAALTAEVIGNKVERLYDVGVAGIHRLLDQAEALQRARVVVVVAGMEGALASVVAGLVASPVIAVPTSVGYGASFNGLAALLTMLNSCANGIAVVNIDNGFGAGYLAGVINRLEKQKPLGEADS